MVAHFHKTYNETHITHELSEDTVVRPKEGSITAAESSECVLCGSCSRKSRKRQSCNTYQEGSKSAKVLKTILRLQRKYNNLPIVSQPKLDMIESTICEAMKERGYHKMQKIDKWFM